ncbi:unnamed protein product, partial [Iphiclides podalirius]
MVALTGAIVLAREKTPSSFKISSRDNGAEHAYALRPSLAPYESHKRKQDGRRRRTANDYSTDLLKCTHSFSQASGT